MPKQLYFKIGLISFFTQIFLIAVTYVLRFFLLLPVLILSLFTIYAVAILFNHEVSPQNPEMRKYVYCLIALLVLYAVFLLFNSEDIHCGGDLFIMFFASVAFAIIYYAIIYLLRKKVSIDDELKRFALVFGLGFLTYNLGIYMLASGGLCPIS
jgi:hypothetical protein